MSLKRKRPRRKAGPRIVQWASLPENDPPEGAAWMLVGMWKKVFVLVDMDDLPFLSRFPWSVTKGRTLYVYSSSTPMSEIIMGRAPEGMLYDHCDGNSLNNRRSNLRLASLGQNAFNCKSRKFLHRTSLCKGVTHRKHRWQARCGKKHIGLFATEEEAAVAYDRQAREIHKQYGTYNFPLPGERSALTGEIVPVSNGKAVGEITVN